MKKRNNIATLRCVKLMIILIVTIVPLSGCIKQTHQEVVVDLRLLQAVNTNDLPGAQNLIDSGSSVNAVLSERASTVLMQAARGGSPEMVQLLLDRGADVNQTNPEGETALLFAAYHGNSDIVAKLLAKGANTQAKRARMGITALHIAAARGDVAIMSLLIAKGAEVNAAGAGGVTPMRVARELDQQEAVKVLKTAGAKE